MKNDWWGRRDLTRCGVNRQGCDLYTRALHELDLNGLPDEWTVTPEVSRLPQPCQIFKGSYDMMPVLTSKLVTLTDDFESELSRMQARTLRLTPHTQEYQCIAWMADHYFELN